MRDRKLVGRGSRIIQRIRGQQTFLTSIVLLERQARRAVVQRWVHGSARTTAKRSKIQFKVAVP